MRRALTRINISPFDLIAILCFLFIHLYFKLFSGPFSLYGDEAFSVFNAQQTISEFWALIKHGANPPLFYILLHWWILIFGIEPMVVKSLPIICSLLTAITIYATGKRFGGTLMAFIVSACFLFSNLHFDFSHEIRAFALVCFFTSISFYLFLRLLQEPNNKLLLVLIAIVNAALPFTHYNSVLVPIVQFIFMLAFHYKELKGLKWLLGTYLVSLIIFLPQFFVFIKNIPDDTFWLANPGWTDLQYVFQKIVGNDKWLLPILVLTLVLVLVAFISALRRILFQTSFDLRKFCLFLMWWIMPILLNYVVAQFTPSFRLRYVLFSSLGLYLMLAYAIQHLRSPIPFKWIVGVALTLLFYDQFNPVDRKIEDWKKVVEITRTEQKGNAAVLLSAGYKFIDFTYYFDRKKFANYKHSLALIKAENIYPINDMANLRQIKNLMDFEKIILIQSHHLVVDPNNEVLEHLKSSGMSYCKNYGSSVGARVHVFKESNLTCENLTFRDSAVIDQDCAQWIEKTGRDLNSNKELRRFKLNTQAESKCANHWNKEEGFLVISNQYPYSPSPKISGAGLQSISVQGSLSGRTEVGAMFVLVGIEDEEETFREEYQLKDVVVKQDNELKKFQFTSITDHQDVVYDEFKVYLWNYGQTPVLMKDLVVDVQYSR